METVIDLWKVVDPPDPPEIKPVSIDPTKTALLVLDIQGGNCNAERRPRCVDTLAGIQSLMERARSGQMRIIYSLTSKGTAEDIRQEVIPLPDDTIVKSSVDKFFGTQLEDILNEAGIENVILVGTAAEGAVLHTATGAALRGLNVVVPVDGLSSSNIYAEQYTTWHLANSPGTSKKTTLTRIELISF